jgi:ABC-type transporter Mla MlaB component
VVFSFFKKDPKDTAEPSTAKGGASARSSKPGARPLAAPVSRNASATVPKQPNTESSLPDKDLARTLAMETAAKIDAIESEMARDFMRPSGGATLFPNSAANSTLGRLSQQPVEQSLPPATLAKKDAGIELIDLSTDDWQGNANAIELHAEGSGSAIDEAANLFAHGLIEPAEAGLRAAIHSDSLGDAAQRAWLMLFELFQQRGDKGSFDNLTIEYVLRFESSPPAWMEYKDEAGSIAAGKTADGAPIVRLPDAVDANVVKVLEQLKNYSAQHQALTLDASGVREVDLVGAELLLRVINAFKRASHELLVLGADQLITPLRAAVEPGRRDQSDAGWMLLLEVFRLLQRQHDFEETGIQYCITYEVSPPSWEPPPPNLKTGPAPARSAIPVVATPVVTPAAAPAPAAVVEPLGPLDWRGAVEGEGEPHFGRLVAESRSSKHLQVECRYLQRMAFSAASALLTHVMKLQSAGVRVEFRNVNPLVVALLNLLGVTAVATVQPRRP